MFIHAQAIKATLLGKFQLVEELVVEPVCLLGIIEFRGHVDPHTTILLFKILR